MKIKKLKMMRNRKGMVMNYIILIGLVAALAMFLLNVTHTQPALQAGYPGKMQLALLMADQFSKSMLFYTEQSARTAATEATIEVASNGGFAREPKFAQKPCSSYLGYALFEQGCVPDINNRFEELFNQKMQSRFLSYPEQNKYIELNDQFAIYPKMPKSEYRLFMNNTRFAAKQPGQMVIGIYGNLAGGEAGRALIGEYKVEPNFNINSAYDFENFEKFNDKLKVILASENLYEDGLKNAFTGWNAEPETKIKWEASACDPVNANELFWNIAESFQECVDTVSEAGCTCDIAWKDANLLGERYRVRLGMHGNNIIISLIDTLQDNAVVEQYLVSGSSNLLLTDPSREFGSSEFISSVGDLDISLDDNSKSLLLRQNEAEYPLTPQKGIFRLNAESPDNIIIIVPDTSRNERYNQYPRCDPGKKIAIRICASAGNVSVYDTAANAYINKPVNFKAAFGLG